MAATVAGVAVVATDVLSLLFIAAPRFLPDLEGPLELEDDVAGAVPPDNEEEVVEVEVDEDELVQACICDDAFCCCCWCNCCCCCGFCW